MMELPTDREYMMRPAGKVMRGDEVWDYARQQWLRVVAVSRTRQGAILIHVGPQSFNRNPGSLIPVADTTDGAA